MWTNIFVRQTVELSKKNLRLQRRNKAATCAQLFVGVFFLFLLLLMDAAIKGLSTKSEWFILTESPRLEPALWEHEKQGNESNYIFIYGPTREDDANEEAMKNVINYTRSLLEINEKETKFFSNGNDMDSFLRDNPVGAVAAVYFDNSNTWALNFPGSTFSYTLQVNETIKCDALRTFNCNKPRKSVTIPLQNAIDASFVKIYGQNSSSDSFQPKIDVSFSDFAHPELPVNFDVVESYGSTFLYIAVSFNYVIQLTLIVEEKELHLVDSLRQMGMLNSAYWTSWMIVNTLVNTAMVLLVTVFGLIFGIELFKETTFGLLFTTFWLSAMAFTAFGFFLSTLFRTSSSARLMGIGLFIVTFIAVPIMVSLLVLDGSEDYDIHRKILSLLPPFPFYQVVNQLIGSSAGQTGIGTEWKDINLNVLPSDPDNLYGDSFWSMKYSLLASIESFFLFSFLAWYFDQVLPSNGKSYPPWFPFLPSYWLGRKKVHELTGKQNTARIAPEFVENPDLDVDVQTERKRVLTKEYGNRDIAVEVQELRKVFNSGVVYRSSFTAVDDVTYAIEKDSVFVMLGHNGAGKTTTINMLTGMTGISNGDAKIFGLSAKEGMDEVREVMGVCPQHDILWNQLTGREHLEMFAHIKGVPHENIKEQVDKILEDILLTDAQHKCARDYSGGMRRRLSVGISLIGDPKIVYLDEPTTGMDPVTRKAVWDMINTARKGRVIVLTTHSMEEADVLGDRIAIMSHGAIQAIGTSLHLKKRYGSGYRITVFVKSNELKQGVINFFASQGPKGINIVLDVDGIIQFQLPNPSEAEDSKSNLTAFFQAFEQNQDALGVTEYSLSMPTLEEVFLKLAKEDNTTELGLLPVPPGAQTSEENKPSLQHQLGALFMKSYAYQRKQKLSCCCIISFPLLVMLMILAIDFFLFSRLKLEYLCEDFTREQCAEMGPNIDCILEAASYNPVETLSIEVGKINRGGYRGGVNPNCNSDGCFNDLEKALFTNVPIHKVLPEAADFGGLSINISNIAELRHWHADLLFLSTDRSCENEFNKYFDVEYVCENITNPKLLISCQQDIAERTKTLSYLESEDELSLNLNSTGNGFCGVGTDNVIETPTLDNIEMVEGFVEELNDCITERSIGVFDHFEEIDLVKTLQDASIDRSGILGGYTTQMFPDSTFDSFFSQAMGAIFAQSNLGPGMISPELLYMDINTMCSIPEYREGIVELSGSQNASDNICAYASSLDIIRAVSFLEYESPRSLRTEGHLAKWYGEELQTELMRTTESSMSDKDKYLARQYYSHWQSYEFLLGNNDKGEYAYNAFFNNSGSGNTKQGNWQSLVWTINNAIAVFHTGKGIETKIKAFPTNLKCNRDAWLAGLEELDCDILPGFFRLSILDFFALSLFPYLLLVHMFVVVSLIVYEKENRLRMIMKMMGLSSSVYWIVNFLFYYCQYIAMITFMWALGSAANLQLFTYHDTGVLVLFFGLWGILLVIFSFLLTVFFKSSRTTTATMFLLMLIVNTTGSNLIETMINDPNTNEGTYASLMWFPPLVMIRGIMWLCVAAALNEPISMSALATYGNGGLRNSLFYMFAEIIAYGTLFWYLDKVYVVDFGVRTHPLFFLQKSYWFPEKDETTIEELSKVTIAPSVTEEIEMDKDIEAEYKRAIAGGEDVSGQIVHLNKVFPNGHVAVKTVSMALKKNECLGLLGHNGAGKTTLINMISGLFEPSHGQAYFGGYSIKTNIDEIHRQMGVCPQHDVLWNALNAYDHLRFYGRLKGLRGKALKVETIKALNAVNLGYAAHRKVGTYSGGMKRRLSVANSLIGQPSFVYLDEPSTGLDPASRRQLWKVIREAKGNKTIILTTHSMEEAEVLCDRIAVMAVGKLQCIGNASELKNRYGKGYTLILNTSSESTASERSVETFVKASLPSAVLLQEPVCGLYKFEVDRNDVVISKVFEVFSSAPEDIGLSNWGLTETTLEEVFLKLANLEKNHVRRSSLFN